MSVASCSCTPSPAQELRGKGRHPAAATQICCSCPETKAARDNCTIQYGPDAKECQELIEAHKQCLRAEGFNVRWGPGRPGKERQCWSGWQGSG